MRPRGMAVPLDFPMSPASPWTRYAHSVAGYLAGSRGWQWPHLILLERLQVGQQVMDLIRIELEHRHCGMSCFDPLGQRFAKRIDWVAIMKRPERRRDFQRTFHLFDRSNGTERSYSAQMT